MGSLYNSLGYAYLSDNNCSKAISIFKAHISLAPNDANAHDSLDEAYYTCGKLDVSITEYEKALTINPDHENSKEMLQKAEEVKKKLNN